VVATLVRVRPVVIGVAGGTGAGKSTIVTAIVAAIGDQDVTVIQHDWYYRDRSHVAAAERARLNYDHPDALDTALLVEHLAALRRGEGVDAPTYDFTRHCRAAGTRRIEPRAVLIVDGILVLAEPEVREALDIRVFVDTDADLRLIRRIQRDIAERGRTLDGVLDQYQATTRPMHLEFVEPSKRYAHVIIPEGGENQVGIEMLVAQVRALAAAR